MKDYKLALFLIGIVVVVIFGAGVYVYNRSDATGSFQNKDDVKKVKKTKKDKSVKQNNFVEKNVKDNDPACIVGKIVEITSWQMPDELLELSGITWFAENKIAGVQDQKGIIYIYDLAGKKVVNKISFGPDGDYEGITFAKGHFFVMRSDGYLFEVEQSGKVINEYDLPFTKKDNIESLYYDSVKNRMLTGQKDGKKDAQVKSFFAFDLTSGKFNTKPVYSIDLNNNIVACGVNRSIDAGKEKKSGKKKNKGGSGVIRPSDIVIDRKSGNVLIADGPGHRILVMSPDGAPEHYLSMDKNSFPQVEGMLFSPSGELYISTEGTKTQPAKISKVSIVKIKV